MEINLFLVLYALLIHYFADFVCQNDAMATNKSSSNKWLAIHVSIYTTVWFGALLAFGFSLNQILLFCGVTFVVHFITDYLTSRWTTALYKKQKWRTFFDVIGLDQLLHYFQIFFTLLWIETL